MRRLTFVLAAVAAALVFVPGSAIADSGTQTYALVMFATNMAVAPNGDHVAITCTSRQTVCGTFQVHPKALPAPPSGEFTHTSSSGAVLASGTWTATDLIDYDSYGCGVVMGDTIPSDLCGGALKLRVLLTPKGTTLKIPGILTVFCIIGPNPPNDHDGFGPMGEEEEGVALDVPGIINFNHSDGGGNTYVRQ